MATIPTAEKVGQAWRQHRGGDNDSAIRLFQDIVRANPENVDACYGLGLSHKAIGENDAAAAAFRQALSVTEKALSAVEVTSHAEGHTSGNDLGTNIDDRYMMLTRMLKQRIEDVGG